MSNEVERELMKCKVAVGGEPPTPARERVEGDSASALEREGVGGVAGDGAGKPTPKSTPRYSAGNVVLADVDHLRAYSGETDELLYRMRTVEAEEEFMRLLDGGMEPDWFVERWDAERKVLVACLVFEREEGAKALGEALAAAAKDGAAKCVRFRDDAAMRREVAEYFSAEWGKAHEREMAKVAEKYDAAVKDFGGRILIGWIGGGLDAEKRKWRFGKFGDQVKGISGGLVAHAGVDDDVLGRVNVALGFRDVESAMAFQGAVALGNGMGDVHLAAAWCGEDFGEVARQMVVAMAKRLAAYDAKAKAAKAAKYNGKDVG